MRLPEVDDATPIEDADVAVAQKVVRFADHPVVETIGEISDFSDQEPLYAATGAVIATGLLMRDAKTVKAGTRMLAAHLLAKKRPLWSFGLVLAGAWIVTEWLRGFS